MTVYRKHDVIIHLEIMIIKSITIITKERIEQYSKYPNTTFHITPLTDPAHGLSRKALRTCMVWRHEWLTSRRDVTKQRRSQFAADVLLPFLYHWLLPRVVYSTDINSISNWTESFDFYSPISMDVRLGAAPFRGPRVVGTVTSSAAPSAPIAPTENLPCPCMIGSIYNNY